jgi:hypothetical protein
MMTCDPPAVGTLDMGRLHTESHQCTRWCAPWDWYIEGRRVVAARCSRVALRARTRATVSYIHKHATRCHLGHGGGLNGPGRNPSRHRRHRSGGSTVSASGVLPIRETERNACARSCAIGHVMGNLYQCHGSGQLHVCDSTCVQRVVYDNVSTICRLSRRVFPNAERVQPTMYVHPSSACAAM